MIPSREEMHKALVKRHGALLQSKLDSTTVAICGLGGLGSNIAIALARTGIGKLILTDFDKVDITNLHRQQYKANQIGFFKTEALKYNLKEISPYTEVEICNEKINEENFKNILKNSDIICEAFDDAEAKSMLTECVLNTFPDKYLIAASGMAGISSSNNIKTRKITNHFYLCGDGVSDVNDDIGLISSRVMVCASHQAHMVIRIISEQFDA